MASTLQELRLLLELLEEKGVVTFRQGELELTLAPAFARPEAGDATDDSEEDLGWQNTTLDERKLLGIA